MKNQYFGDINDYLKYGLLRVLTGRGEISAAICWMLTPDDGRTDGRFISYLERPEKWRHFDQELFDALRGERERRVENVEKGEILPNCRYYRPILPDDRQGRADYFERFWQAADGCELLFFDPDNGMEVKSVPYGRKNSSKYLYWHELVHATARGHSVLVYQHFPRVQRESYISQMAEQMRERTGGGAVYAFQTARVAFFLLPAEPHIPRLEKNVYLVPQVWRDVIRLTIHPSSS
jgi:hypothetical protein